MIRVFKHKRRIQSFVNTLVIDNVNLCIQVSRSGWNSDVQSTIINNALLIRKYERRLRLIRMR
jgi:hypothetical protein